MIGQEQSPLHQQATGYGQQVSVIPAQYNAFIFIICAGCYI
jgi:hypothetical protein